MSSVDREERAARLVEHQEEILHASQILDTALTEYRDKYDKIPSQDTVVYGIESVLTSTVNEDDLDDVVYPFLNFILNFSKEEVLALREKNPDPDLVIFLSEMGTKYQLFIGYVRSSWVEGPNFWSDVSTEYVKRPLSDVAGLNHRIQIGSDENIKISSSLSGNLQLIRLLLDRTSMAFDRFSEEDIHQQITDDGLDAIAEQIIELRTRLQEDS